VTTDRSAVEVIEQALDAKRICGCGAFTTIVVRDDVAWLECASRVAPARSRLRGFLRALTPHVHQFVIDLREADTVAQGIAA
jgi:hypothetical protein